jgi:DNA-binding MarR family transcriptional regulator
MDWLEADPSDATIVRELQEAVTEEIRLQQRSPDPFRKTAPRSSDQFTGQLNLGIIPHHGHSYKNFISSIKRHWLALGITGGGKTTVIRNILQQILRQPTPPKLLILERKQEYTELLPLALDMQVLDTENLAFNPLRPPPGINTAQWIGIFTECMVNYLDIREASSSFLMDHALRLIRNMESEGRYPNLGDLKRFIEQQPYKAFSKNGQQKETVLNRLNDLLNSLPAMFDSGRQIDLKKLVDNHCLILLHDITHATIQNFIISLLVAQTFLFRKIHHGLSEKLQTVLVLDEAASLFRRRDEIKDHVSFINDLVKTARGYGIGLIAASQLATELSHALLANAGTRMMIGGFGRTEDIDVFLRLRGANKEQRQYVLNHPMPGKAFIVDERWPHIIECNMHNPTLPPKPSTDELYRRIKQSTKTLTMDMPAPAPKSQENPPISPADEPKESQEAPVSIETKALLHTYHHTFMRLRDRAKALNLPSATLKRAISSLESNGHINVHKVHGKAGAPRDLYEVTASGLDLIAQPEKKLRGKGGYLHRFYQQQVADFYRQRGFRVSIEGVAEGKNIDIISRKNESECLAIEIELHALNNPDHVLENIERAAQAACVDRIICLVPTEAERKAAEKSVTKKLSLEKPLTIERLWKYLEK